MPQPVYSARIMQAHATGAETFTVPTGLVLVVRDADFFYSGGVGSYVDLINAAGGTFAFASFPASIDGALISWRGRQVVLPGETVALSATDPVDVMVSGYLLRLP